MSEISWREQHANTDLCSGSMGIKPRRSKSFSDAALMYISWDEDESEALPAPAQFNRGETAHGKHYLRSSTRASHNFQMGLMMSMK